MVNNDSMEKILEKAQKKKAIVGEMEKAGITSCREHMRRRNF